MTKNNLSGIFFSFDYSKTLFIYSHFSLHTKLGNQQEKALELKSPSYPSPRPHPLPPHQAHSPCSPATKNSIWSTRRLKAQTDVAPILDLDREGEGGRNEHNPPRQSVWKNQVPSLQIWKQAQRGQCVTQGHTGSKQGWSQDPIPGPADFRIPAVMSHGHKHGCWSE